MKKEEYMSRLKEALREFDPDLVQEIFSDYEERFRVGAENGRTEEEVIAELGSVEELLEDLRELSGNGAQKQSASGNAEDRKASSTEESGGFWTTNLNLDQMMEQVGKAVKQAETAANKAMEKVGLKLDELSRRMNRREAGNDWYVFTGEAKEEPKKEAAEAQKADAAERRTQQQLLQEQEVDGIRRIVVDGANFEEIHLEPSQNEKLQLQCDRESCRAAMVAPLYCERRGDSLYIGAAEGETRTIRFKSGFFQCSVNVTEGSQLVLRLPETIREAVITGGDSDVIVCGCQLELLTATLDGGDVRLTETGAAELRLVSDGGDVTMEGCRMQNGSITADGSDVTLTKIGAGELTLSADGGDVELQELAAERLAVAADGGDVSVKQATVKECITSADGGDVMLQELETERLAVTADGGDVSVRQLTIGDGRILADGGNVKLQELEAENLTVTADSGDVSMEQLKIGNCGISADGGDVRLQELELENLTVTADSGDVSMEQLTVGEGKVAADGGDISLKDSAVTQMQLCADGGEIECANCTGNISTRRE